MTYCRSSSVLVGECDRRQRGVVPLHRAWNPYARGAARFTVYAHIAYEPQRIGRKPHRVLPSH
jgi:hypothetical protein